MSDLSTSEPDEIAPASSPENYILSCEEAIIGMQLKGAPKVVEIAAHELRHDGRFFSAPLNEIQAEIIRAYDAKTSITARTIGMALPDEVRIVHHDGGDYLETMALAAPAWGSEADAVRRFHRIIRQWKAAAGVEVQPDISVLAIDVRNDVGSSEAERWQPATDSSSAHLWPARPADDAFHGLAGDVVRAIEPHTESDPIAILIQFLAAFGNCVGRGPYYQVEGDRHYANIFAVLIGASSKARKGTSWSRVRQIFEFVDGDWVEGRVHSGLSSGEGLIWAVRDPAEPSDHDSEYSDQNDCDLGAEDRRLMLTEPEFGGVLRVMERPGNILSRIVRDAWDRGNLAVLTKNSPTKSTGAHISIIGHITREELRRGLAQVDMANGFANRFCFVCVRRSKRLPHGGALSEDTIRVLAAKTFQAINYARQIGRLEMSADAKAAWEVIYGELSDDAPGLLGALTARAEAQVIRFALIYALLDQSPCIDRCHLRAAVALWEYCEESVRHVFGASLGDPVGDRIMIALEQAGQTGMTRTAIRDLFKRHERARSVDEALLDLAARGLVRRLPPSSSGGRPAEVWVATKATR